MYFFFYFIYFYKKINNINYLNKIKYYGISYNNFYKLTIPELNSLYAVNINYFDKYFFYNTYIKYIHSNMLLYFKKILFMSFYYNFHINYLYFYNFLTSSIKNKIFQYFFNLKTLNLFKIFLNLIKKKQKYIYFIDKQIDFKIIAICIKYRAIFNFFLFNNLVFYLKLINFNIYWYKYNFYKKFLIFGQI